MSDKHTKLLIKTLWVIAALGVILLAISPQSSEKSEITFTSTSDGYDWRSADDETKRSYCWLMATSMTQEFGKSFTEDFFYESLNQFYSTEDASVLNNKISEMVALFVTAAMRS